MSKRYLVAALLLAVAPLHQLNAAACLCVKRSSDDRVIGYSCNDTAGEDGAAGCQQSCKKAGYPHYDFKTDVSCDELYRRIKKQIPIIDLKPTIPTPLGPLTVPLKAEIKLGQLYDEMNLPDETGGGKSFLKAEDYGSLEVLLDKSDKEDVIKIRVLNLQASMPSLKTGWGDTGTIEEILNPTFESEGEIDLKTGKIWLMFSGKLRFSEFPGREATTYTLYSGQCFECLKNGSFQLTGDSFYYLDK